MRPEIFVDTSAWLPIVHPAHPDHSRLAAHLISERKAGTRFVTTNLVVAESHALIMRRVNRRAALAYLREVHAVPDLIVESDLDIEARAIRNWLERYDDQNFSLVDAVSFEIMTEHGIRWALALDHHFAVAGFELVT